MIPTNKPHLRPAAVCIKDMQDICGRAKRKCQDWPKTSATYQDVNKLSDYLSGIVTQLTPYLGNQRLIDFANAEAAKEVGYFGLGYDVQDDYAALGVALTDIITFLSAQTLQNPIQSDMVTLTQYNLSGITVEFNKLYAVVD